MGRPTVTVLTIIVIIVLFCADIQRCHYVCMILQVHRCLFLLVVLLSNQADMTKETIIFSTGTFNQHNIKHAKRRI